MSNEVREEFVRSFVNFLNHQIESGTIDTVKSDLLKVAIKSLAVVFIPNGEIVAASVPKPLTNPSSGCSSVSNGEVAADASNSPINPTPECGNHEVPKLNIFKLFEAVCIKKEPKYLEMAESLKKEANGLMEIKRYNEAVVKYNRAIIIDSKNAIFYCNRAAAHMCLSAYRQAIFDCMTAIRCNPNYAKAYGRLGYACVEMSCFEHAQQAFAQAFKLDPNNEDYRINSEVARNRQTQPPSQIESFAQSFSNVLNHPDFRRFLDNPDVRSAAGLVFDGMMEHIHETGIDDNLGYERTQIPVNEWRLMQEENSYATEGSQADDNKKESRPELPPSAN